MNRTVYTIAVVLLLMVVTAFLRDANAEVLSMKFDSIMINSQGANIEACLVTKGEARLVIPAPCEAVAAKVKQMICNDPDPDECSKSPLTTFDLEVDGVSRARS